MTFVEMLAKNETLSVADAITILLPLYMNDHAWNVDDTISDVRSRKLKYILNNVLISGINSGNIIGSLLYDYIYDEDGFPEQYEPDGHPEAVLYQAKSNVNFKSLLEFVVKDLKNVTLISPEYLAIAGIEVESQNNNQAKAEAAPGIANELGTLRNEKQKWDASIKAATELGLLFYEKGLEKKARKEDFIREFKDTLADLPDSTIKLIFKYLPSGYKSQGGTPKRKNASASGMTTEAVDSAIEAAAYAGTIYDTDDVKSTTALAKTLREMEYKIPSDLVLQKIVQAVEKAQQ